MRVPLRDNGDLAGDLLGWCSSSGEAGPLPPPTRHPPQRLLASGHPKDWDGIAGIACQLGAAGRSRPAEGDKSPSGLCSEIILCVLGARSRKNSVLLGRCFV